MHNSELIPEKTLSTSLGSHGNVYVSSQRERKRSQSNLISSVQVKFRRGNRSLFSNVPYDDDEPLMCSVCNNVEGEKYRCTANHSMLDVFSRSLQKYREPSRRSSELFLVSTCAEKHRMKFIYERPRPCSKYRFLRQIPHVSVSSLAH
jgi:hypothetical protein